MVPDASAHLFGLFTEPPPWSTQPGKEATEGPCTCHVLHYNFTPIFGQWIQNVTLLLLLYNSWFFCDSPISLAIIQKKNLKTCLPQVSSWHCRTRCEMHIWVPSSCRKPLETLQQPWPCSFHPYLSNREVKLAILSTLDTLLYACLGCHRFATSKQWHYLDFRLEGGVCGNIYPDYIVTPTPMI